MQAALFKGPDLPLEIQEIPTPEPDKDQVLVEIKCAGLNHRDLWIRKGLYKSISYPVFPGSDGAGIIKKVADKENQHLLNQKVIINPSLFWGNSRTHQGEDFQILGMPSQGTLAQYVAVPADNIYLMPEFMNFRQAASLPLAGITGHRALFFRGEARQGQSLLITGTGGGVASLILKMALAAGLSVSATSGSEEKIKHAIALGVSSAVNYNDPSWENELLKNNSEGFDLIIDGASGEDFPKLLELAKPGGKIVVYGATTGNIPQINPRRIFWKQINILGTTMGSQEDFSQMLEFISEKQIAPEIDRIFDFNDVDSAFNYLEQQKQFGKVILEFSTK